MFDLFRRAFKTKAPHPFAENPANVPPPSYPSANTGAVMAEKKMIFDPELTTGCPIHLRYNPLKTAIENVNVRYTSVPPAEQKSNFHVFILARVKTLLGCIHVPITDCVAECLCHDEYATLRQRIKEMSKDNENTREEIEKMSN